MLTSSNKSLHHDLGGNAMGARILEFRPPVTKFKDNAHYVENALLSKLRARRQAVPQGS